MPVAKMIISDEQPTIGNVRRVALGATTVFVGMGDQYVLPDRLERNSAIGPHLAAGDMNPAETIRASVYALAVCASHKDCRWQLSHAIRYRLFAAQQFAAGVSQDA